MFIIHGLFALSYAIGFNSHTSAIVTWIFTHSLHARIPVIQNRGDELQRLLLMWSMFMPIGERLSIDALYARAAVTSNDAYSATASDEKSPNKTTPVQEIDHGHGHTGSRDANAVVTFPTLWILYQIVAVYWLSAQSKTGDDWVKGYAVMRTLHLDSMINPSNLGMALNRIFRNEPLVCYYLTIATLKLEEWGALLLLAPPRIRMATIILFTLMQLGFSTMLYLWLFPVTSTIMLTPIIPAFIWDKISLDTLS